MEDASTNGTFINGERVGKGNVQAIRPGNHLRLSLPPSAVLEYEFFCDEGAPVRSLLATCESPASRMACHAELHEVLDGQQPCSLFLIESRG